MNDTVAARSGEPKRIDVPVETRPYGMVFFVLSLFLALGTLWAVADEVIVRRPWKEYQKSFNAHETVLFLARRDSLVAQTAADEAARTPEQQTPALQAQLAQMHDALHSNPDYRTAQSELIDREFALKLVNRKYQFAKSIYDEKFYLYTEAKHHGDDTTSLAQDCNKQLRLMDSLLPIIQEKAAARDSVQMRLDAFEGPIDSLDGLIQGRTQEIANIDERVAAIQARTLKVQQVVLSDYEPNEFENPIIRVDRCQTCHQGITDDRFTDSPQPFTTHPKKDIYFKNHPTEAFGCTPCHDGQGPALTVEDAHRPKKYWDHPLLANNMVEAGCQKCHSDRAWLDNAEHLMEAQTMLRRDGCFGCHDIAGYNNLPKVAPPLDKVKTKLTESWMADWIKNPRHFRPDTRMPNFRMPDSEVVAVVAFLRDISEDQPAPDWPVMGSRGDVSRGRELVASVGCLGCHHIDDLADRAVDVERAAAIDHGPNLSRIGNKAAAAWVYGWLKNPRRYNPETRMPSLRLTDREASDITAYLLTLKDDSYTPQSVSTSSRPRNDLAGQGEHWVRTYGCYGCHTIPGMEKEGKVSVELTAFGAKDHSELFFGDATHLPETWHDWTFNKMKDSRIYETQQVVQRMPDFAMSDEKAHLYTMLLKSFDGRKVFEAYREPQTDHRQRLREGQLLAEHYNCTGCHTIEGRGGDIQAYVADRGYQPPNLTPEGAKVQSDWLFRFLQEPTPIRAWLSLRMPTFNLTGPEITTVSQYFMAISDVDAPLMYLHAEDLAPQSIRAGRQHFDELQCLSCHVLTEEALSQRGASSLAPNLALAHERLRPDWIIDWLIDPQAIDPGTNMPSFFYSEGERLYDDADEQIRAIRDYLMTLRPM